MPLKTHTQRDNTIWSKYGAEELTSDIDWVIALEQYLKGRAENLVEAITAVMSDSQKSP